MKDTEERKRWTSRGKDGEYEYGRKRMKRNGCHGKIRELRVNCERREHKSVEDSEARRSDPQKERGRLGRIKRETKETWERVKDQWE